VLQGGREGWGCGSGFPLQKLFANTPVHRCMTATTQP